MDFMGSTEPGVNISFYSVIMITEQLPNIWPFPEQIIFPMFGGMKNMKEISLTLSKSYILEEIYLIKVY